MRASLRRLWFVLRISVFVLLATTSVFSQSKNRVLNWAEIPISATNTIGTPGTQVLTQIEALEIKDISVGGKSITIGQPFAADDDWLTSLTLRVKNISDQTFSSIQIDLILPEIMPGGPLVSLCCGGVGMERNIMPGDEVELNVVAQKWVTDQIKSKSNPSSITKAQVQHISVKQPDGKKLLSGCMRTADPKSACPTVSP